MRTYKVKVRYTFDGHYCILAEDRDDAERIAEEDCGLVLGRGIHTSNDRRVVDWHFDTHPEERILPPKRKKTVNGAGRKSGSHF